MADDAATDSAEAADAVPVRNDEEDTAGIPPDYFAQSESAEGVPYYLELWNDYDPSMRFVALFPVGEDQGATLSSVAYYIIEPGKHTGVHSDNAEEIVFITEGLGEAFVSGRTQKLEAGTFAVFPAGVDHDVYAQGAVALRLLSFFPTAEVISSFQQVIYPVGGNELSSKPPRPVVSELDPNDLPEDFPFDLTELGLTPGHARGPSLTERLVGMAGPDAAADRSAARREQAGEPGPEFDRESSG